MKNVKSVHIKFSLKEKEELAKQSREKGFDNISQYIRFLIRKDKGK